jgi:hypothetical protein
MDFLKEYVDLRQKVTWGWEILINEFINLYSYRDSSVGIATGYGLDDQAEREFESR